MTKTKKNTRIKVRVNKAKRVKSVEERTIDKEEFIDGFEEKVEHYVDDYVDKMERTKQLTLISGVGFFMLLILFFYAYNFKFQVTNLVSGDENPGITSQMETIKKDIGDMVDSYKEIKEVINTEIVETNINEEEKESKNIDEEIEDVEALKNGILTSIEEIPYVEKKEENQSIEELKKKLLEDNVGVSSDE